MRGGAGGPAAAPGEPAQAGHRPTVPPVGAAVVCHGPDGPSGQPQL